MSSYEEAATRKEEIKDRLQQISVPSFKSKSSSSSSKKKAAVATTTTTATATTISVTDAVVVPIVAGEKTDTHWDFLLKEMQWLAADFASERQRHKTRSKKLATAVFGHAKTASQRRTRALAAAEVQRRKRAARIGRVVIQKWWQKMERVVTYKQKLVSEAGRRTAMNQQLVKLVQQTEQYTLSLSSSSSNNNKNLNAIEEALASTETRRSKQRVKDYARMVLDTTSTTTSGTATANNNNKAKTALLYGESTEESGSDATYSLGDDEDVMTMMSDDETTMRQAEAEETAQRGSTTNNNKNDDDEQQQQGSFVADPVELQKLRQEADMDVDAVIERLQREGQNDEEKDDNDPMDVDDDEAAASNRNKKAVTFAASVEEEAPASRTASRRRLRSSAVAARRQQDDAAGGDADDDMDASDVEDYNDDNNNNDGDQDDDDEFVVADGEADVDDETTMEMEEKLPPEMSSQQEIELLKRESEVSVEELRKKYAAALGDNGEETSEQDDDDGDEKPKAAERRSTRQSRRRSPRSRSDTHPSSALEAKVPSAAADEEDEEEEQDFVPAAGADVDDERTIEAEEKLGRDMSYTEELALLQNEGEMPIEQLRAMYQGSRNDANNEDDDDDAVESEVEEMEEDGSSQPPTVAQMISATNDDNNNDDNEEYAPDNAAEAVDDETTMIAEEKLGREMSYEDEISMLQRENEMSVEELRAMYSQMEEEDTTTGERNDAEPESELPQVLGEIEDQENDEDFRPDENLRDDETTIEAEERLGSEMSAEEEIALLQRESEIPVESLRGMYQDREENSSDDEETNKGRKRDGDELVEEDRKSKRSKQTEQQKPSDTGEVALDRLEASAELARGSRASRPFIIPSWVKLREYQQTGLNWLVSLQSRRLNGILADEMGLGKTLQTISLLAYLACYKGIWGPHLIVVPTSVILNWETELKRFCPALKVLCYYGTAKRRKELRTGWTKSNCYHVVITSYQLAVQDAFAFKRKKWYYLVLDEAQNIKNFQSQRWQTLINFNTQRRLLLTGTPLQNSLMELWSLLHFLMPHIFRSRKEFSYWFANPMNSMIEGTSTQNDSLVSRLHGIIRPFILRRLKKDVETQLPGKFEHILKCQLSRRQMVIYEEFMARSSTRQALKKGGNFMGMMNVLMQLRKVCNHPDLFEPRSVVTPFVVEPISVPMPSSVFSATNTHSVLARVSESLRCPLWCGSEGEPSWKAYLRHDVVESKELLALEASLSVPPRQVKKRRDKEYKSVCPALRALAEAVEDKEYRQKCDRTKFQHKINSWRCQSSPFPYPQRLLEAVSIRKHPLQWMENDLYSTPAQLLAMRRDQHERAQDVSKLVKKFVFCVPKAGARPPVAESNCLETETVKESTLVETLLEPLEECLEPFREAQARLSSFFPDSKLVQYDAGKLQTLAELLRERKRGGHKVLIFTQMSKMLDILEAFLNLNGHTYLRLDGGTSVDRRQRLMDHFNNDPKVFCFILSTRSGGVGVNLTGADTVVFYDSDWNPAQDAQAQDRAHRIGQTREVHIYRLITEHSVEENILIKATQKRNLDRIVMDRGNFNASQIQGGQGPAQEEAPEAGGGVKDMYTKGGLRAILGISSETDDKDKEGGVEEGDMTTDQIEKTMTSLEDIDDVNALRGAQKEAAEELKEFDESIEYKKDSDAEEDDEGNGEQPPKDEDGKTKGDEAEEQKRKEKELEKEFATWQEKVGMDASAIDSSLSPLERYGLRFREDIDPYYSIYAVMEYRRKMEAEAEGDDEVDLDEVEREKALEERRAMDEGDLLATDPRPEDLIRQRNLYRREKARLAGIKKRRKLTGENWECKADAVTEQPFWYNIDTGEAIWEKPGVLLEMEAYELATEKKWEAIPLKTLIHLMGFLNPFPERMRCAQVCSHWHKAATDISFVRHVYPVEMGADTREDEKMEPNHYRSLNDALAAALPGDTLELSDGHYWQNSDLIVDFPLRFVGDEHDPSNVVIEISGTIVWRATGGFFEGVTLRRPKISGESCSKELLCFEGKGKLDMIQSSFDNEGSSGSVVIASGSGSKGRWENCVIQKGDNGILLQNEARLDLVECVITKNERSGVVCKNQSEIKLTNCAVEKNGQHGISLSNQSRATILRSSILSNKGAALSKETGCSSTCSGNFCSKGPNSAGIAPPGFQFVEEKGA